MVGVIIVLLLLPLFFVKKVTEKQMVGDKFKDKWWYPNLEYFCAIHNLPVDLIVSQIIQESGGKESVVSSANAIGLMQIKQIVLDDFNKETRKNLKDLKNPIQNIEVGTWYIKKMIKYFDSYYHGLMAYANGIGNYQKFIKGEKKTLPHPDYADKILKRAGYMS